MAVASASMSVVITSYSIHYTKLYEDALGVGIPVGDPVTQGSRIPAVMAVALHHAIDKAVYCFEGYLMTIRVILPGH